MAGIVMVERAVEEFTVARVRKCMRVAPSLSFFANAVADDRMLPYQHHPPRKQIHVREFSLGKAIPNKSHSLLFKQLSSLPLLPSIHPRSSNKQQP